MIESILIVLIALAMAILLQLAMAILLQREKVQTRKIDKILSILNSINPEVSKQIDNKVSIDVIDLNQQIDLEARDKALSKINSTDDNYIYEEDYLSPEERELI